MAKTKKMMRKEKRKKKKKKPPTLSIRKLELIRSLDAVSKDQGHEPLVTCRSSTHGSVA